MTLGALQTPTLRRAGNPVFAGASQSVIPVSLMSDWIDVCTSLLVANNSGSSVIAPYGITTSTLFPFCMMGGATGFQARMKYDSAKVVTGSAVVQFFGFDSGGLATGAFDMTACVPQALYDGSSTPVHELTFATATSTDVKFSSAADGIVWAYTPHQELDAKGNMFVLPTVKTAVTQASSGVPRLQIRIF